MKRKKHSSAFKFRVALAAVKGNKTITEICQQYEISASLVHKWKKELLEHGAGVFATSVKSTQPKKASVDNDKKIRRLYEKVGQLTVERDFLKKSWEKYREDVLLMNEIREIWLRRTFYGYRRITKEL